MVGPPLALSLSFTLIVVISTTPKLQSLWPGKIKSSLPRLQEMGGRLGNAQPAQLPSRKPATSILHSTSEFLSLNPCNLEVGHVLILQNLILSPTFTRMDG